ncbi:hypothetical protein [Streptomyces sp. NPDC006879]|uniref:hypothetical protein n=1 Tax=Streptomyces sp. NPDC006879 TaxID=3364767 RepID=UPI00368CF7A2
MRIRAVLPGLLPTLLALCATALLCLAATGRAHAHGDTLSVVVTGQQRGHVTAEVTWENDDDPVSERVSATVNAVSDDGLHNLGPWLLVRDPGTRAGYTTTEALPPGSWKVTVEAGFPALGRGERVVDVTATAPAAAAPAVPVAPPVTIVQTPSGSAATAVPEADVDGFGTGWWIAVGGLLLATLAAVRLIRSMRA